MIALEARDACLTIDGRIALDRLDFTTRGDRVLLVGGWSPLVRALSGDPVAALRSGALQLAGQPLGAHQAVCGVAPRELPLPARMSLFAYLAWAARLRGLGRSAARARAEAVLGKLGLAALSKRRLDTLSWPERGASALAQALIADPPLLVVETPFAGLDRPASTAMLDLLGRATEGRAAVVVLPALDPTGPEHAVTARASDVLILHDGAVVLQATPSELATGSTYAVTVAEGAHTLADTLRARGAEVHLTSGRLAVHFPAEGSASDILAAAHAAGAAVIACEALWRQPRPTTERQ